VSQSESLFKGGQRQTEVPVNDGEESFRVFVGTRLPALKRSAWLLVGDVHLAEDLVQTALTKAEHEAAARHLVDPRPGHLRRVRMAAEASLDAALWGPPAPSPRRTS
jgi:hypothetical protein